MRRIPRWAWIAAGIPLGILVLLSAGWAVDSLIRSGHVARNVELAGQAVGGMSHEALSGAVDDLHDHYAETTITVETPNGSAEHTLDDLGVEVDVEATEDLVMDTGGGGVLVLRPLRWALGLVGSREAPASFVIDRARFEAALQPLVDANAIAPVEPGMQVTDDGLDLVAGQPGEALDTDAALVGLESSARDGDFPDTLELAVTRVDTARSDDETQETIDRANELAADTLVVGVADQTAEAPPSTLYTWFRLVEDEDTLEVELDEDAVRSWLGDAFSQLRVEPVDAGFTLTPAGVQITPHADGQACCTPDAVTSVRTALDEDAPSVSLDLETLRPHRDTATAEGYGIVEPIGSFTTNHASGQSRVTNIHRMADIVRGAVIEPGGTFSINDHVGQRTTANGFVEAGVIYKGVYEEDVGGGVSQFATTTFNAAFFAGLDFGEYQSHSLYISRYPYGREATVSYPHPDLELINNTPYGVMIWTYYTGSSITVELWSTKSIDAQVAGQYESSQGRCKRVTTERTRTWLADGRQETDSVFAVYRPAEGVNC